jgi:hypothetical protein
LEERQGAGHVHPGDLAQRDEFVAALHYSRGIQANRAPPDWSSAAILHVVGKLSPIVERPPSR